ncbi:hypothetical protein QS306_03945 [Paraburkholderia bonniea]|uniref:hypothetical protein n=1 Tax=Paraburkholderia bonniea TaxID=2152891 RepID=UPI002572E827|nr:hypothetical protein [Paraburkholderia bonniea]WJF90825.1 hypothetical protein QS306_03945 [Paraburkholderia bonniea]WJF94139.1 hypothetical protein QS308_03945 [Paraburkholderia bonniea]
MPIEFSFFSRIPPVPLKTTQPSNSVVPAKTNGTFSQPKLVPPKGNHPGIQPQMSAGRLPPVSIADTSGMTAKVKEKALAFQTIAEHLCAKTNHKSAAIQDALTKIEFFTNSDQRESIFHQDPGSLEASNEAALKQGLLESMGIMLSEEQINVLKDFPEPIDEFKDQASCDFFVKQLSIRAIEKEMHIIANQLKTGNNSTDQGQLKNKHQELQQSLAILQPTLEEQQQSAVAESLQEITTALKRSGWSRQINNGGTTLAGKTANNCALYATIHPLLIALSANNALSTKISPEELDPQFIGTHVQNIRAQIDAYNEKRTQDAKSTGIPVSQKGGRLGLMSSENNQIPRFISEYFDVPVAIVLLEPFTTLNSPKHINPDYPYEITPVGHFPSTTDLEQKHITLYVLDTQGHYEGLIPSREARSLFPPSSPHPALQA